MSYKPGSKALPATTAKLWYMQRSIIDRLSLMVIVVVPSTGVSTDESAADRIYDSVTHGA